MSQKKVFVSGPLNVVRLEGKVGKLNKCIYVFFDIHIDAQFQTKCADVRSEDIAQFVIKAFDKSNEKDPKLIYDFFFERGPLRPYKYNPDLKGIYLEQMSDLFMKSFEIDTEKKIVHRSSLIPNVRFHYVDIRDYAIDTFTIRDILFGNQLYSQFNLENFEHVYNDVAYVGNIINDLKTIIYDTNENPKIDKMFFSPYRDIRRELPKEYFDNQTKKMIYKIKNLYENDEVKKIINKIIDAELKNYFTIIFSITDQCLGKLGKLIDEHAHFRGYSPNEILIQQEDGTYDYGYSMVQRESAIFQILVDINLIVDAVGDISLMIMDLYLLRRFLDKKYVTNALSYTGGHHSQNYIRLLVKYFGFNITHYSYLKNDDIKNAEELIKKSHTYKDLSILFQPPLLLQCSDMTNFPPLFE